MKFTANRESLAKAVADVMPAINIRSPKEVLQNVRIHAGADGKAAISGTNMETTITTEAEALVSAEGTVLIPAQRLVLILKESEASSVEVEVEDSNVHITLGSSDFKLPTVNPDEYPSPKPFDELPAKVKASVLYGALHRTSFCCDPDSSRFALGGVLFAPDGSELHMVGTDGRRLAHVAVAFEGKWEGQAIVPQSAANAIARLLPQDGDEVVSVGANTSEIMFQCGSTTLRCRQVEGRYPNWQQVIPNVEEYRVVETVQVADLHRCLRQAAIVADAETRGVDFEFESGKLSISASASDLGKSRIEMIIGQLEQNAVVRLDHRYTADFMRYCGEESCVVHVNTKNAPVLLAAGGFQYVVMPMSME